MSAYEQEWKILSTDVDMYHRLKLYSFFTRLQETAVSHTEALGIGREQTLDKGLLWVIAQQSAVFHRIPVYDETVRLRTWPGRTMHLFFPRYWQLLDGEGSVIVEASAFWALMHASTRKIAFPEKHGIHLEGSDSDPSIPFPTRIKAEKVAEETIFTVPFSYLDINGHMNNARYFDLAMDCLPEELCRRDVRKVATEYIGEARHKDALTLRYGMLASGETFYVSGENGNHTVFRMNLQY